ncbi:MAG: CBS domain-containing protein [Bacteroidia bacterium]|nr:CBS domain-containing protein [Bacteroidia bacterium]
MFAKELISHVIPSLKPGDHGLMALGWMEEFKVSHLPMVDRGEYLGMISDSDIIDLNEPEEAIGTAHSNLSKPSVQDDQHIYEVMKVISEQKLTVIPVLDSGNRYLGLISLADLIQKICQLVAVNEPGGIIVLEMNQNDYSLSQIAQIVEGNDTRILSCFVSASTDTTKLEVTLKLNRTEISGVLQTFERYNYKILTYVQEKGHFEDVKNRYDEFMRFLNI